MKDKYFFHHLNSRFFEISGKDSKSFIQNLITNDIEKCNDGSIIYSCLLTPQGKFLADFFIFNINENYIFETNDKFYSNLLGRLKIYKLRSDIEIKEINHLNSYSSIKSSNLILARNTLHVDKNITLVSDGDWAAKIFTISDSQYMMDDSSPLPMAYGWLDEDYTSTTFNFSDVLVRKTILESAGSTDFEEYWEDLSLRIYSDTADSSQFEREIFNIKYALNHKNVVDNEYLLITSSRESRYSVFENSEIEIYYIG